MTDEMWNSPDARALGMRLNGDAIDEADERGERVVGNTLLVLFNSSEGVQPFTLPADRPTDRWEILFDTCDPWTPARRLAAGGRYELPQQSMAVLRLCNGTN
jgi:glycogen operon protein